MFRKECFYKVANGEYGYKNGIHISRINNKWYIYTTAAKLATCLTLRDCKYWLANNCK